jgi:hypothetical protein
MLPKGFLPILSLFFVNFNLAWSQQVILKDATPGLTFQLRHLHAALPDSSRSLFANVNLGQSLANLGSEQHQILHTNSLMVHKPRLRNGERSERELKVEGWDFQPVLAPNISDRKTLYELSKMTHNAYFEPSDKEWYGIGGNWTASTFSYKRAADEILMLMSRTFLSAGNLNRQVLEDTYSCLQTTLPSSLPSRGPLSLSDPERADLRERKTS